MQTHKEMMFPVLQFFRDGKPHKLIEVFKFIETFYQFTDEELNLRVSTGRRLYEDRAGWAVTYLSYTKALTDKTRLLERVERGTYQITTLGKKVVKQETLFQTWLFDNYKSKLQMDRINRQIEKTPRDIVDEITLQLKNDLKSQILSEIKRQSSRFFEDLVLKLIEKVGYGFNGCKELTNNGADGGIDGIISEDELGLSKIYIQAKRWENNISRPELQKFVGAISDKSTKKGLFITTSNFTREAIKYAQNIQNLTIVLIDGEKLADLMIKYKVGVYVEQSIELCKIDTDFFDY